MGGGGGVLRLSFYFPTIYQICNQDSHHVLLTALTLISEAPAENPRHHGSLRLLHHYNLTDVHMLCALYLHTILYYPTIQSSNTIQHSQHRTAAYQGAREQGSQGLAALAIEYASNSFSQLEMTTE